MYQVASKKNREAVLEGNMRLNNKSHLSTSGDETMLCQINKNYNHSLCYTRTDQEPLIRNIKSAIL
jgi:hypothetical protein